ncbi:hypothetical protein ACGFYE_39325 [Streptomyces zaomyceticus]|uniref:hypothetical protein n=1 Tax=Streptomyces zaomyceticus TaxID=68286 RepID=UPI00371AA175
MPQEPADPARIARRVVRRRAKVMDAGAVAAALEDAHFNARQDSRNEDLADDKRARAELAEWERLDQLLAADAAAAADHEAAVRQVLCKLGALEQTEARDGDETVRDKLTRRAGGHVQADVDARRAHALAAHLGHYRNPAPGKLPWAFSGHRPLPTPRCSPIWIVCQRSWTTVHGCPWT